VDISRACLLPGWMTEGELTYLADAASRSTCIAEIGSWRGRSTRAMADNTSGMIYAIDTWADDAYGYPGWWTTPEDTAKRSTKDWLWKEFSSHLNGSLHTKVFPMRMHSVEAAVILSRYMKFDMIFIDADHEEKSVREDILAWRPLLRAGGLFCGHDYNHPTCPGVKVAVDALIPNVEITETIWHATF